MNYRYGRRNLAPTWAEVKFDVYLGTIEEYTASEVVQQLFRVIRG